MIRNQKFVRLQPVRLKTDRYNALVYICTHVYRDFSNEMSSWKQSVFFQRGVYFILAYPQVQEGLSPPRATGDYT